MRLPAQSTTARLLFLAVAALTAVAMVALFLRVNLTPSVETGLYLRVPEWAAGNAPAVGDLVYACAPEGPAAALALERDYLRPTATACASGVVPVLKRVVAVGGQTVRVNSVGLFVDGLEVAPAPPVEDSGGRPLRPRYGTWPLEDGALWLGSDIPNGFDSRYFGPFEGESVRGRARLLVSF